MAFFFIVCNQGSLVIDIQGASKNPVKPSTPLDTSTQKKSDYDSQLWEFAEPDPQVQQEEPGYCYLRSKLKSTEGKSLIIDIQSKQYASTPMPIQADTQPPSSGEAVDFYQVWTFVPGPGGGWYYYIQSLHFRRSRGIPPLVIERSRTATRTPVRCSRLTRRKRKIRLAATITSSGSWSTGEGRERVRSRNLYRPPGRLNLGV